jgi:C4-dicarboxylate transporter
MMPVMDIVTYMMHIVIYMMSVMDIVIYMSCIWFLEFLDVKNRKKIKKFGQFAVRRGAGARQIDLKGLPE